MGSTMWYSRDRPDGRRVVCIACGEVVPRSEAREYDKEGDRWERHGKEFEHLCKDCFREQCHQPRDGLEAMLVEIERAEPSTTQAEFVREYTELAIERYGPIEE